MAQLCLLVSLLTLTIPHLFISGVVPSATFTIVNKCDHTVWPGILSNAGIAQLSTTGFPLQKGESKTITAPSSWGGRFWGRTLCSTQESTGKFTCVTGDCGSGKLGCAGVGAAPPATLAEFTLDGDSGLDFYDVSLVDGYNLPMLVVPQGGTGVNCTTTGCVVDLNGACPSELKVTSTDGERVACKSACEAFGQEQYCCKGAYNTAATCKPSSYSQLFKNACPRAYSYAYDDGTSIFTCASADYLITFCPPPSASHKSSSEQQNIAAGNSPLTNNTMVYEGAFDDESSGCDHIHMFPSHVIASAIAVVTAIWSFAVHFMNRRGSNMLTSMHYMYVLLLQGSTWMLPWRGCTIWCSFIGMIRQLNCPVMQPIKKKLIVLVTTDIYWSQLVFHFLGFCPNVNLFVHLILSPNPWFLGATSVRLRFMSWSWRRILASI